MLCCAVPHHAAMADHHHTYAPCKNACTQALRHSEHRHELLIMHRVEEQEVSVQCCGGPCSQKALHASAVALRAPTARHALSCRASAAEMKHPSRATCPPSELTATRAPCHLQCFAAKLPPFRQITACESLGCAGVLRKLTGSVTPGAGSTLVNKQPCACTSPPASQDSAVEARYTQNRQCTKRACDQQGNPCTCATSRIRPVCTTKIVNKQNGRLHRAARIPSRTLLYLAGYHDV